MNSAGENDTKALNFALNRRHAMILGGIGLAAAWAERDPIMDCFVDPTDVNQILKDFPEADEIPGAAYVCKVRHRGAKLLLGHVRQNHWYKGMTEEDRKIIVASQADVERIIGHGMDDARFYFKQLLDEGEAEDGIKTMFGRVTKRARAMAAEVDQLEVNGLALELKEHRVWLKILEKELPYVEEKDLAVHKEKMAACEQAINDVIQKLLKIKKELLAQKAIEKADLELHAVKRLQRDRGLKVMPAETVQANLHASSVMQSGDIHEHSQVVMENREDIALELASKTGDAVNWTLYGAGHDFRDAVRRWNRKHPNNTFSLVEITPVADHEDEKKSGKSRRYGGRSFFSW